MPHRNGRMVTDTLDYDGGRQVTAYVPAATAEAVVYAGDGQLVAPWGRLLERLQVPPVLLVGTHRADDEERRIREYSPGNSNAEFAFDPEVFAAHEGFFVDDVRNWVAQRFEASFSRERTAAFGVSAGGELALAMGMRHPEIYGSVLCASPGGGYLPPADLPAVLPRTYLVAGRQEPFFLENATRWANALDRAGAEVTAVTRDGSHGGRFWAAEFPRMVAWAFGDSGGQS